MAKEKTPQRTPLRVPISWHGQDRAFVVQLERVLDDVYRHLFTLEKRIKELEGGDDSGNNG